jgi:hypothetical protein
VSSHPILGFLSGRGQNPSLELGVLSAGYFTTVTTKKTCQGFLHKAYQPKSHRVDAASQLPTYRPLRLTAGNQEDNLGPLHLLCSRAPGTDQFPKSSAFWRRKNLSFQHPFFATRLPYQKSMIQCTRRGLILPNGLEDRAEPNRVLPTVRKLF